MKKNLLTLLFVAICLNCVSGQKINIQMKVGYLDSKIDYSWETPVKNEIGSIELRPTFALSVDGQLYKGLYVGAEIGTCSYMHFLNFSYSRTDELSNFTSKDSYLGWYKQEQVYFTVNPQLKFGYKHFFSIGGGVGIYNNTVNSFINGYRSTTITKPQFSHSTSFLDGEDYVTPHTIVGGFFNAVANPHFKNIGFVFEVRYIYNDYSKGLPTDVQPDIKFNSFAMLAGLSFHF